MGGSLEEEEGRRRGSDLFLQALANVKGGKAKSVPDVPPHCPCLTVLQQGEGRGGRAKDFPRP